MTRTRILAGAGVMTLVIAGIGLWTANKKPLAENAEIPKTQPAVSQVNDDQLGVAFSIPATYQKRGDVVGQNKALPAKNFERSAPQGFFTVRQESGLAAAASLLKRDTLQHIESEIRQFSVNKYINYKEVSLKRRQVAGKESVEHTFKYTDKDMNPIHARVVVVPFTPDTAYYFILQAHEQNFPKVTDDLEIVLKDLDLKGTFQSR